MIGTELEYLEEIVWHSEPKRFFRSPRIGRRKTHCIRGHEFTQKNTYFRGGKRFCRACHAEYQRFRRNQP